MPLFGRSKQPPSSVTIPFQPNVGAMFVVFFAAGANEALDTASLVPIASAWRERHLTEPLRGAVATFQDRGFVSLNVESTEKLPKPPVQVLRYTGLGELEERILDSATRAVIAGCPDFNVPPRVGLWAALATALAVSEHLEGIVFDPEALRIVKQDSALRWFEEGGRIAASQHVIVPFSVGHGTGLGWMTTRGLGKFGLPDLELQDVPPNLDKLNVLVNSAAQLLMETGFRAAADTKGSVQALDLPAELQITPELVARAYGRGRDDDRPAFQPFPIALTFEAADRADQPPMIRLRPPAGESDAGVWLNRVAQALLGSSGDARMVKTTGDRMMEAHRRALEELPHARERFAAGMRPGELLYVKHGFKTRSGSEEYLWVVVTQWTDSQIRGQVANDPIDVPSVTMGQAVVLDEAGIFDWTIQMPGGRSEGGYTAQVTMEEGQR